MHELLTESTFIFRVLRAHYEMPADAPVIAIYEKAARRQGLSWCADIARVDYTTDYLEKGIVAAYVEAEFVELNREEQKRVREAAVSS
jgi:hypothetical protein